MSEKEILKINEKYTVILDQDVNFKFYATRNGENWRDLTGDKLVLAMFQQLQTAKEENERLKSQNKLFKGTIKKFNLDWYEERLTSLTQQNKQMRECLENMANKCEREYQCVKNSKGCIAYTYREDCYKFNAQQALKGAE